MNLYVKVKDQSEWFLFLSGKSVVPECFQENTKEKLKRSSVCALHNTINPSEEGLFLQKIKIRAVNNLNYKELASIYQGILIRSKGSYMPLRGNEIVEEVYSKDFPIDEFAEIVICENDEKSEYKWRKYLKNRFPNKTIATINFFDLRSDFHVHEYFKNAKIISFSTTFTNLNWYKKLAKHVTNQKVIGYCHNSEKWKEALEIYDNVEIVDKDTMKDYN